MPGFYIARQKKMSKRTLYKRTPRGVGESKANFSAEIRKCVRIGLKLTVMGAFATEVPRLESGKLIFLLVTKEMNLAPSYYLIKEGSRLTQFCLMY